MLKLEYDVRSDTISHKGKLHGFRGPSQSCFQTLFYYDLILR